MAVPQSNRWCFTANNPGVWRPPGSTEEVEYMVWQLERGQKEGTEHIQGYIRFKGRKRMTTAKKWFGIDQIHLELAKGNEKQNRAYCTKEETRIEGPHEYGKYDEGAGVAGRRVDLETVANLVKQGKSEKEVAEQEPETYIKYHGGIGKLIQLTRPPPPLEREMKVYVLWGPTGTGKTHRARMTYPEAYEVIPGRDPWGMYSGQAAIIFDEFDEKQWTIQSMNRYCDKWRCSLDARYNNKYAEWTRVVICANSPPDSWWENAPQPLRQAFWRRITVETHVVDKQQEVNLGQE